MRTTVPDTSSSRHDRPTSGDRDNGPAPPGSDSTAPGRDHAVETGQPFCRKDPRSGSRLGAVIAIVGAGLLMQGIADALARSGDGSSAMPLFLIGMTLIFGVCAWRLTGAPAHRNERLLVSLVLGLGLLASTSYAVHFFRPASTSWTT